MDARPRRPAAPEEERAGPAHTAGRAAGQRLAVVREGGRFGMCSACLGQRCTSFASDEAHVVPS